MQAMMDVVAPLGIIEPRPAVLSPLEPAGMVVTVFDDEMDIAAIR
jgi:hypothetical protein